VSVNVYFSLEYILLQGMICWPTCDSICCHFHEQCEQRFSYSWCLHASW